MKKRLTLVSGSARRKEILHSLGWAFDQLSSPFDEASLSHNLVPPEELPQVLAHEKVRYYVESRELSPDEVVLGADTIVVFKGKVLGKPKNHKEATEMLRQLSGQSHDVISAHTFWSQSEKSFFELSDTSRVTLKDLSDDFIRQYVSLGLSLERAGAYGIQDEAFQGVASLEGSFFTVMGLAKEKIEKQVSELGWNFV